MTPRTRTGTAHIVDTGIHVWEEDVDEDAMLRMLRGVLGHLAKRGWSITRDPRTVKNYPTLSRLHFVGVKGDLKLHARVGGRHVEIVFYQELVVENPNGGQYDFGKFERMPRTMRLEYVVEMSHVARKLAEYGYTLQDHDGGDLRWYCLRESGADDRRKSRTPLERFNLGWGSDRFERDASGWPAAHEYQKCNYHLDRDKVPMSNGDTKYLRYRHRLMRVVVYTNMNNMWMVTVNGEVLTYVSNWELFDCADPSREPRRRAPRQAERLHAELGKATETKNYRRVAAIARTLAHAVAP